MHTVTLVGREAIRIGVSRLLIVTNFSAHHCASGRHKRSMQLLTLLAFFLLVLRYPNYLTSKPTDATYNTNYKPFFNYVARDNE